MPSEPIRITIPPIDPLQEEIPMDRQLETTVWLTLEPQFHSWGGGDATGMTVSKMTKSKPKGGGPKVKLKMPSRAFAPLAPTVTIEVPEDALSWPEPEITVESE